MNSQVDDECLRDQVADNLTVCILMLEINSEKKIVIARNQHFTNALDFIVRHIFRPNKMQHTPDADLDHNKTLGIRS